MCRLSVIIPVYNAEKYLNENLSALHDLGDDGMEFIVVNDGSTDSSLDICTSYARKDSRFRVISKPNGGVSDARNVGLDEARGQYIFFLDSDDKISPEFEECVNESMKFDVDFVFFNRYFLKEKRKDLHYDIKESVFRKIAPNSLYEVLDVCSVLEQKCFLGGSGGMLLKRSLIDNTRFDKNRSLLEDYDFFLNIIHKGKFKVYYCNRIATMIRADMPNSLTKKRIPFRVHSFLATTNPYLIANKKLGRQLFWVEANFNMQKFDWRDRVKYAGMIASKYKDFIAINKFSISCCLLLAGINVNRQRRRIQGGGKSCNYAYLSNFPRKTLYITSFSPFNLSSGGNQRSHHICRTLCEMGNVDVLCYSHKEEIADPSVNIPANYLRTIINRHTGFYYKAFFVLKSMFRMMAGRCCYEKDRELSNYVDELLSSNSYDLVLVRYMQTLYAADLERVPEVVVDIDDIPWMAFNACVTSLYKWPVSCICKWMESNIRMHFARVVEQGNLCFVSNQEQITFPQLVFLPNIPAVEQVDEYLPFQKKCNILLFVGLMGYSANYISIDHFVSDIWPLIKRRVPDAVLRIVGRDLPARYEHTWKDCLGVQVLGFVDNISDEYLHAKVFISPLTIGGGTNIKILEAMKYGLPIVATSFSVRGYSTFIQNGENVLIADDNVSFAEKCTELLVNRELNERIAIKSRLSVDHIYSYENFKKIIMTHIFQKAGKQEMGRVL